MGAVNAASPRLHDLNSASQLLYNGVHLVELTVQMKVGEYYALQSTRLREMQNKANLAMAKARERMMPSLDDLKSDMQLGMRKVTPIIQTGLLSLAVLDPKVAHQVIDVSVWVESKAADLHERLAREVKLNINQLSHAAQLTLVDLSVAGGTLEPQARQALQGMKISAQQAAQLVQESFTGLRGAVGSWQFLLTLGGMYLLSDSLGQNLRKVETEIGQKSMEAVMALYGSSLGLLGGGVEVFGLTVKKTRAGFITVGESIVRLGAAVSAFAGAFDMIQAIIAAKRARISGDEKASKNYSRAAFTAIIGVGAAAFAILRPLIFGPLGIAISLSILTYSFFKHAERNESKPLERWALRCYFGYANETPRIHWHSSDYSDIAIAELNAATLGVFGNVNFKAAFATPEATEATSKIGGLVSMETKDWIEFSFTLTSFIEEISAYHCTLVIHRQGDGTAPTYTGGELIINENALAPSLTTRATKSAGLTTSNTPRLPDLKPETLKVKKTDQKIVNSIDLAYATREISGSIELAPDPGKHNILGASLTITYWPDRQLASSYAEIAIQDYKQ